MRFRLGLWLLCTSMIDAAISSGNSDIFSDGKDPWQPEQFGVKIWALN